MLTAENERVSITYMEGESFSLGPPNDYSDGDTFYNAFQRYCRDFEKKGGNLHYPIGGWWHDMDDFLKNPVRPSRFFSIDPDGEEYKKAGRYLVGYNRGFYGEIGDLPERMLAFARENNLALAGPMFNIFLLDEVSVQDPSNYLMQASILLK